MAGAPEIWVSNHDSAGGKKLFCSGVKCMSIEVWHLFSLETVLNIPEKRIFCLQKRYQVVKS